jgi:2-methylisocitrate lyase-like PEP mutase family enzyme
MTIAQANKARAFVIATSFDGGSAHLLAALGFEAHATPDSNAFLKG